MQEWRGQKGVGLSPLPSLSPSLLPLISPFFSPSLPLSLSSSLWISRNQERKFNRILLGCAFQSLFIFLMYNRKVLSLYVFKRHRTQISFLAFKSTCRILEFSERLIHCYHLVYITNRPVLDVSAGALLTCLLALGLPRSLLFESHITKLRWQPWSSPRLHSYPLRIQRWHSNDGSCQHVYVLPG